MSNSKQVMLLKVSGLCGIFSPIIALSSIFLAVSFSPSFSWIENWISDLAGTFISPIFPYRSDPSTSTTAIILNLGLTISGILSLSFAFGLRNSIMSPSGRFGTLLLIFGSAALCGIGIFPEPTGNSHIVTSIAFFFLTPIGMFYIGAAALDATKKLLGYLVFILSIITLLFGSILLLFGAIPEIISILAISIFSITFGIKLFRKAPNPVIRNCTH